MALHNPIQFIGTASTLKSTRQKTLKLNDAATMYQNERFANTKG